MSAPLLPLALAAGVAGCGASGERLDGRRPDPLDADWLQGSATITAAHLTRAFDLGAGDPEVAALARDAVAHLGGGDLAALAACFSLCPATVTLEGGLTTVKSSDAWLARSLEELAFGERSARAVSELAEIQKGRFRDLRVTESADFIVVERTYLPQICLVAHMSVASAYEAIVHELVHATRLDPRWASKLAETSVDDHGFLMAFVQVPGGEVDAYTTGTRARLRLVRGEYRSSPLLSLFDPRSGEPLVPAPTLAEVILGARPQGLGYADGLLHGKFASARATLLEELEGRRDLVEKVRSERRQNIDIATANLAVHSHNQAAHEHNLGIARSRGDQALVARSREGAAEAARNLVRTRAIMAAARASEARLTEQLATLARQRDALR